MTLVEPSADRGLGEQSSTPAPEFSTRVPERAEASKRIHASSWQGAWGKLGLRAAGIAALMLGLGGIGAFATAHGQTLNPPLAAPETSKSGSWLATQAGMAAPPTAVTQAKTTPAPTSNASVNADEPTTPAHSAGITAEGKVVLNLANAADFRKLPGVGQKRAEALLALRQKLGKFRRVSDLLRVKGIGPKRLKQWQDKVVLDADTKPTLTAPVAPQPAAARPAAESRGDAT